MATATDLQRQNRADAEIAERRRKETEAERAAILADLDAKEAAEDTRVREAEERGEAAVSKLFESLTARAVIEFMAVKISVNIAHPEGAMRDIALEAVNRLNRWMTWTIRDMSVKAYNMGKAGGSPTASGTAWLDNLLSSEDMLRPAHVRGLLTIEYPRATSTAPTTAPRRKGN